MTCRLDCSLIYVAKERTTMNNDTLLLKLGQVIGFLKENKTSDGIEAIKSIMTEIEEEEQRKM